jgi:hypothetical protein
MNRTDIYKNYSNFSWRQSNALSMKFSNTLEKHKPKTGKYAGQEIDRIDFDRQSKLRTFLSELALPQKHRDERIQSFMKKVPQATQELATELFSIDQGIKNFPKKYENLLQKSIKACS